MIFAATFSTENRPGADLGAIWRRKRPKDVFFSIWDRFWDDLAMILDQAGVDFQVWADLAIYLHSCLHLLTQCGPAECARRA